MSIGSMADWEGLAEVGRITRLTLDALEAHVRPGVSPASSTTWRPACSLMKARDPRLRLVYGFPRTVLISVNDEIVHGVPGRDGSSEVTSSSSMSPWRRTALWPTPRGRVVVEGYACRASPRRVRSRRAR